MTGVVAATALLLSSEVAVAGYGMAPGQNGDGAAAPVAPSASASMDAKGVDLSTALKPVAKDPDAELSVAVLDTESGTSAVYGESDFDTASIVKVDILATLLLQAQDAGRELTAQEKSHAEDMIRLSDNAATTELWDTIGRAEGLAAANERFDLTSTEGGRGGLWGLTQTTAADQVTLLSKIFSEKPPLTDSSRSYLQNLMEGVAADQDWGISAAADAGTDPALKDGWLQRSRTDLWDINSIGRIESAGRTYLVAVLSNGHTAHATGVKTVEATAKAARAAVTKAATP